MDLLLWCCPFLILNLTWATWRVSCRKQRFLTPPEHLNLPPFFDGIHVAHMFFSFKRCLYCFGLEFAVLRSSSVVFYKNKKIIVLRFFFFENLIFIWNFLNIFYQRLISDSIIQKYFSNKCVGIFATIIYVKSRNTNKIFEKYFWIIESDTKRW
jgi:hypothetical protein